MRDFLTFVAVALVTALSVALVAPPFIDWTARHEMVARAVALRIGTPVRISGPISLRLLPTPYLQAADISIGDRRAPWLTARAIRIEFGLSGAFGGRIALEDLTFDHPNLKLGPRFAPPRKGRLAFGRVHATGAEIRIERSDAAPILLRDVSFEGAAGSETGFWRGAGDFALNQGRAHFQFASDAVENDALPLRGEIDAAATRADFDGRVLFAEAPSFAGTAALAGKVPVPDGAAWPWRIAGEVVANGDEATMADGEVRLGEDARALQVDGRMTLKFGETPALDADLKGKTLDIDALLRRNKETFVPPSRAGAVFAALIAPAIGRDTPLASFSLKLQARAAYLGARTLNAPTLALAGAAGSPTQITFASGLPGRGQAAFDGALAFDAAPSFRGHGQGGVADFPALAAWIAEGQPDLAARLASLAAALPQGAISAAGDIELSPEGYAARGLKLGVAASRFDGSVVYRLPTAAQRGRLYMDLASPALDIDAAPNVEAGLNWLGSTDLDFHLQADALRVARIGLASVSGGSLAVRAVKEGETFALKQLSLADLGGASIEAEGETSASTRWTRVKLDAARLSDFAALLARAAPGAPTRWLLQHADDLGAAKATFEARRDGPPLQGPFAYDFLKSEGAVGGSHFSVTLTQAPAPVDAITARATLDSPDAGGLLRKLGVRLPPGPAAAAQLSLDGSGRWDRGFAAKARLTLAGAELNWSGAVRPEETNSWVAGPLRLKGADLIPALAALGLAAPGATAPVDLSADVEAGANGARWSKLQGSLAGSRVSGELAYARDGLAAPAQAAVSGAIVLDRASFGALASLVLGRAAPARPGAIWPDAKFGPAALMPPSLDVALNIGALDLGFGVGRAVTSRLQMDRDRLALVDASALLNGGRLSGRLDLGRGKSQATASGELALQGVLFERAGFSARLDANLDFAGAGESAAALIGGLAGAGRLKIGEARIPRHDPQALARALDRIEKAQGPPPDEKRLESLIGAELDKAPLALAGPESALAVSQGALHFGPLEMPAARVSGAFDLARLSLALDTTQTYAKIGRFWSGPPPQIEITQRGALEAPTRKIDAQFLAAGLAAEAIARESDRIANFEADVRERAMFNRKRKAQAFLDRRRAEIAAYLDEQERRRLMDHYLGPYSAWAASHGEAAPMPPHGDSHAGKDAAGL